jgi:amino acid adenylation domain-containing protein
VNIHNSSRNSSEQILFRDLEQPLGNRFEQQVSKYPGRIAVKTPQRELTYQELNEAANRLATLLLERGCAGKPVALVLEHGASMIVAILAALKTGSMYVPLDPAYPSARLAWILEDSGAAMVVTNRRNRGLAAELVQDRMPVGFIDDLPPGSCRNPACAVSPDSLANLLYTSGTTGTPKGVPQNHRTITHEILNYTNGIHIIPEDRMLLVSSFSFADATRTLYGALLNGACLCPVDLRREGMGALAGWLRSSGVTIFRSVATVFRNFAASADSAGFPGVRLIYLAGEPVYASDIQLYRTLFGPDCILVNGLGSSEALTFCWFFVDRKTVISGHSVPVGHALPGKHVSLVDETGNEVSHGEKGEFVVRSRFMTPGYWRRPDLNSSAFIPDRRRLDHAVPDGAGERSYRTGDLGVMLEDGCLLCLGRRDFQVKIRGHRVEIPEIEATLTGFDDVDHAAVATHPAASGESRLTAYIVPKQGRPSTAGSLRLALSALLPDYMMPASFVLLKKMPLLPNGKIDRRALPPPGRGRPELDNAFVEPRTPTEQALCDIWADVLGLDKVGVTDSFLELGGDSLLAMQVLSRSRKMFGTEFPVSLLFECPNIAEFAARVDGRTLQSSGFKVQGLNPSRENESQELRAFTHPPGSESARSEVGIPEDRAARRE